MPYDADSGQAYTEKIVSARWRRCSCSTLTSTVGSMPKYQPPARGVQSMNDIALRRLLCNLGQLDTELLRSLPEAIIDRLWTVIKRSNLDSLQLWQVFSQTHLGTRTFVRRVNTSGRCERHSVSYYIDIAARPGRWLTNLCLSHGAYAPEDLCRISRLANLRNIHLNGGNTHHANYDRTAGYQMTDRIVTAWADAARNEGALSMLQMIFIQGHKEVTTWSLRHLNAFPALDTFCTQACGLSRKHHVDPSERKHEQEGAGRRGWARRTTGSYFWQYASDLAQRGQSPSWMDLVDRYMVHRRSMVSQEVDNQPLLHMEIGETVPRPLGNWLQGIVCFERDETNERPSADVEAARVRNNSSSKQLGAKRRKLKNGKGVALGDMLSGL